MARTKAPEIFLPSDSLTNLNKHLDYLANPDHTGLGIGVPEIDEYLMPLSPSDMTVILARPSHGKSSIMAHYAMQAAESAVASLQTDAKFAPPLYVTAESPVEELSIKTLSCFANVDSRTIRTGKGNNDWTKLKKDAAEMFEKWPILYAGHSLYTPRRGLVSIQSIERSVKDVLDKYGMPPRVILVDYLQRIVMDGGPNDRRLMLSEVVERLKDLQIYVGCPLIFGSQAVRGVDDRPFPVPDLGDGKESGVIEETADIVISCMRPSKYWKIGTEVPKTEPPRVVTDNLFFVRIIKQRNGEGGKGFWVRFDMSVTQLSEMEEIDLQEY